MARRSKTNTVAHYYDENRKKRPVKILLQYKQEKCRDSKRGHNPRPRALSELPTHRKAAGFTHICTRCGASIRAQSLANNRGLGTN
jgi:hypothetical protein